MSVFVNRKKYSDGRSSNYARVHNSGAIRYRISPRISPRAYKKKKKNNPSRVDIIYDVAVLPGALAKSPQKYLGIYGLINPSNPPLLAVRWGFLQFFVGSRVTKLLTLDLLLPSIYLLREIIRSLFLGITATKLDRLILKSESLRCFVLYHVFIFLFFKFTTTLAYCITQSILFC